MLKNTGNLDLGLLLSDKTVVLTTYKVLVQHKISLLIQSSEFFWVNFLLGK